MTFTNIVYCHLVPKVHIHVHVHLISCVLEDTHGEKCGLVLGSVGSGSLLACAQTLYMNFKLGATIVWNQKTVYWIKPYAKT